jgi:hypothetical protein
VEQAEAQDRLYHQYSTCRLQIKVYTRGLGCNPTHQPNTHTHTHTQMKVDLAHMTIHFAHDKRQHGQAATKQLMVELSSDRST